MSDTTIERLEAAEDATREQLVNWLAPHETRVMFILDRKSVV
jgi:hypothetical protein